MRPWQYGDATVAECLSAWYLLPEYLRSYSMAQQGSGTQLPVLGGMLMVERKGRDTFLVGHQFAGKDAVSLPMSLLFGMERPEVG